MDIQGMLDAFTGEMRLQRSKYHLTLGGLIDALKVLPPEIIIQFDIGGAPVRPHSYRGYYSDLSFETSTDHIVTAGDFLAVAHAALGETYNGYKGGDFTMTESTPLWVASYGCTGDAIVGLTADGILTTRRVD